MSAGVCAFRGLALFVRLGDDAVCLAKEIERIQPSLDRIRVVHEHELIGVSVAPEVTKVGPHDPRSPHSCVGEHVIDVPALRSGEEGFD